MRPESRTGVLFTWLSRHPYIEFPATEDAEDLAWTKGKGKIGAISAFFLKPTLVLYGFLKVRSSPPKHSLRTVTWEINSNRLNSHKNKQKAL